MVKVRDVQVGSGVYIPGQLFEPARQGVLCLTIESIQVDGVSRRLSGSGSRTIWLKEDLELNPSFSNLEQAPTIANRQQSVMVGGVGIE